MIQGTAFLEVTGTRLIGCILLLTALQRLPDLPQQLFLHTAEYFIKLILQVQDKSEVVKKGVLLNMLFVYVNAWHLLLFFKKKNFE
jgi:hypothetical protein